MSFIPIFVPCTEMRVKVDRYTAHHLFPTYVWYYLIAEYMMSYCSTVDFTQD